MSGFRRYKSQVFWGQMENLDRGAQLLRVPGSAIPDVVLEESRDETDASEPENNTTVIHVEACDSPTGSEERSGDVAPEDALAERSFSSVSRGQRSQDSGFSDSGRSDSSSGPRTPRRRRRRRRPQSRADGLPHTSTPKHEANRPPRMRPPEELVRQLDFSEHRLEEEEEKEETLGDFLYAQELPEEELPVLETGFEEEEEEEEEASWRPIHDLNWSAPVNAWLEEIRSDVEEECMSTLQSKRLPRRKRKDDEPESRDLRLLTASATIAAKKIIDIAESFDCRYQQLIHSITGSKSGKLERDMLVSIETEATEILLKLGLSPPRRIVPRDNHRIPMQLGRLKNKVDRELDKRLDFYIEKVVLGLEEAPREGGSAARGALAALTALGLAGPRAGASVARCSGIRALLTSLISAGRLSSELRCSTLRALASICCCLEAVDQFVIEGGPDILVDVLTALTTPQAEKSEAAALLVQITAPWIERAGLPHVEPFAKDLIRALTNLAEDTSCKQTLLLAAAGINNLAHSRRCVNAILECDSIKKLLRCVKKSNGGNVWLMEQVAALVGQVSRMPEARSHLVESRASVALVCFLRMQPPGLEAEYQRLEETATEALTRLCVDRDIAKQVVAVGGSDCLPKLDSQNLVTKSLRAARKIAAEHIDIARITDYSPS